MLSVLSVEGKRPEGISQFVPCDFNPSLTYVKKPEPAHLKLTGGVVNMTVTRAAQQEQTSEKKPNEVEQTEPKTKMSPPD